MENQINIAELLKDCPKGMELDCPMYDNVQFDIVQDGNAFPIKINTPEGRISLSKYGCCSLNPQCKCVIFPKGKTTWEGFVPPCKFKDGDILAEDTCIFIVQKIGDNCTVVKTHCTLYDDGDFDDGTIFHFDIPSTKLATEEEKQKLFQAIKKHGYKWNAETKTLENLVEPRFYAGVWVVFNNQPEKGSIYQIKNTHNYEYTLQHILGGSITIPFSRADMLRLWTIDDAKDGDILFHSDSASNGIFIFKEILQSGTIQKVICYCDYDSEDGFCLGENHTCCWTDSKILHPATKEQRDFLFQKIKESGYKWNSETKVLEKLIKPIFKAGNKVRNKNNHNIVFTITDIGDDTYVCGSATALWFEDQDNYELVPNKFDISTLIPFESRVLVRDKNTDEWRGHFFSHYDNNSDRPYICIGLEGINEYNQCIPYEENKYLLGKTDDCDEFYKTWKDDKCY